LDHPNLRASGGELCSRLFELCLRRIVVGFGQALAGEQVLGAVKIEF